MQITKRQVRPDALAAELTDAQARHNEEVAAAKERLALKRDSVIARATQRVTAVRDLQADLAAEEAALSDLIRAA